MQEGMLFNTITKPGGGEYVIALRFELKGQLNVEALQQSWQQVVDRHTILRTGFFWEGNDHPVQVVYKRSRMEWAEMDWRGISRSEQQLRLKQLLREERKKGFDLRKAPLMRMTLVKLDAERYELIWSLHHILMDGWSRPIVLKEVFAYYESWCRGESLSLEAGRSYRDYIVWIRGRSKATAERYWKELLKGFSTPTRLAAAINGKRIQIEEVGKQYGIFRVNEKVTKRLNELSRQHQITLNTMVQCGWGILLSRYSGENVVVFGTVVSGRSADIAGIEKMVGLFINTLPVKVEVREEGRVKELLRRIQDQQVMSREYEHSHLVDVQAWSEVGKQERLFDTLVSFQNYPIDDELREIAKGSEIASVERVDTAEGTEYGITLVVTARDTISLHIGYDPSHYKEATINRMLEAFERILDGISSGIDLRISEIEILSEGEKKQILYEWNDTHVEYFQEDCVHGLFEQQVERAPHAVAVAYEGDQISYRELNRRANQLAHYLIERGGGPEVLIGICVDRGIEMIVAILGVLKAGGAYVPIEPDCPRHRLNTIISDSQAHLLIAQRHLLEDLSGIATQVICLDSDWDSISTRNSSNPDTALAPANAAYVIYTSGSTGQPKGVIVTHYNIVRLLYATSRLFQFGRNDVWTILHSITFDFSVWEMWGALGYGGRLIAAPKWVSRSSDAISGLLDREQVSVLNQTPTAFRGLAKIQKESARVVGQNLRWIIFGGEAMDSASVEEWIESRGSENPLLVNMYGITETTVHVTQWLVKEGEIREGRSSIGRAISDLRLYILNRYLDPVPVGVPGEIYVGGGGTARGYLKREDLTGERFIPDPYHPGDGTRLYKTGDLGRYKADGEIEYLGRIDNQVKVRGYRIELGEIEAALKQHSAIRDALVLASDHEIQHKRLVAYIVTHNETMPEYHDLRRHIKERLPEYMVPAAYVRLERLPLTANGKVDKRALPQPKEVGREREESYREPQTEVEEVMAGIWRDVLKVERVVAEDNFFELGGHSLLATRVVSRIREVFQIELPLRAFFEEKSLADLSRRVETELRTGAGLRIPPIERVSRQERMPLSFAQQRLWFIDQLEPGGVMYNVPRALRVRGELRLELLERVLSEVVRRHEALRTRFEVREGQPVQVIEEARPVGVQVIDVSGLEERQREKEARRIAGRESARGFDLGRGPLLRARVLRLARQDQVLLLTMHHVVSDEWSMGVLIKEVNRLYAAYSKGESSPLEELAIQYADYAVWQREWLQGEVLERQVGYWRERLEGMEALELPTDRARPVIQSYEGASEGLLIPEKTTWKLRELARREGVTMFMLLQSAFRILLYRYSGQERIVVGTPIAGRNYLELEPLIGFFVNILAVRTDLGGDPSVREAIRREREAALGAYAHQDVPFEKIVEELQPERDLSRHPIFQVTFIYEKATEERVATENLKLNGFESGFNQVQYDLRLAVTEGERGMRTVVRYCKALFNAGRALRMLGHLGVLLERIALAEERTIREIEILSDQERGQILYEWNDTGVQYPGEKRIHELFAEQAEQGTDRIALICGRQQLSYGELNRRANQLGRYLQELGVGPEVIVGVCLERSVEMVVGVIGVLKAGGAYLPLDPESPLERLSYMLEESGVGVVLAEQKLQKCLPALWGQAVLLDEEWEWISRESESAPKSGVEEDNLAYVIYTSGSTGRPKGVMVTHKGLCNLVEAQKETFGLGKSGCQSRVLQFAPFSFDASVWEIFNTLIAGGSLYIYGRESWAPGAELVRVLREDQITIVTLPPAILSVLEPEGLNQLEIVIAAGEACSAEIVEQWASGRRFLDAYGPTEATVCASVGECEAGSNRRPAIGRPIANIHLYILDWDLKPVPVGAKGYIYISGAGLARGYIGKAELTGEKFIPNWCSREGGERLYRTGDVGRYLPDGNIEFIGRADGQVKVNGYRIELGEIEAVLDEHRCVKQSVVVVREDERGGKRLLGYVVEEQVVTDAELKGHVREKLPEYMVPEAILVLEEMPLTANGKVDRKRLPEVKNEGRQLEQTYVAARTPVEEMLIGIFEEVLKIEGVGREDNFFELGGHSLLATQMISRVRNAFGVEIAVGNIFKEASVKGVARSVEEAMRAGARDEAPLVRGSRERQGGMRLPLSFAQERLWFIDQLEPGNAMYNVPTALRVKGELRLELCEGALHEVVRRHEVLRTRFEGRDGQPAQVIDKWGNWSLERIDLTSLTGEESEAKARLIAREEAGRAFDLSRGPLLRMKVLQLQEEEHLLLFTTHHIVSDGWSMGILIREVGALYRAYSAGDPSPLEELPIQYADFAVWQRAWLQGDVLERQIQYWREQLDGLEPLDLPADHTRPARTGYRGSLVPISISGEVISNLVELSRQEDVTLFMTLLAAIKVLMNRYTGQEDIVIGTNIANRNRYELEGIIGFFVNNLVLRTDLSGDPTFRELLSRVRGVALKAYVHQDLPFEKLVEALHPQRYLNQMPLFQVAFVLQNAPSEPLKSMGLNLRAMSVDRKTSKFDLTFFMEETSLGLVGSIEYRVDLFDATTISRMRDNLQTLLIGIVDDPSKPISSYSLVSQSQADGIVSNFIASFSAL